MRVRILVLLATSLLTALMAVGCGGSGGKEADEATASPLSVAAFIKRADAACSKRQSEAQAKFLAYSKEAAKPSESSAEREAHIIKVAETIVVPELQREVEDIKALGVPEGREDEVKAILQAIEAGIEKARAHPELVLESSTYLEPAGKLARKFGLKVCGAG